MHVGIAGTGKMGSAMARNLLDRRYRISVWNIDRAPMDPLVTAGATPFEHLESLVACVDAVIVMLWDDEVAREVSLGKIMPAARKGQLIIESSTLSPQMYELLAEAAARRGVNFLACPVFGSVDGARAGTLALFPGGNSEAFERGRELLSAMGSTIRFTGSPAASGHLKLASNSMLGVIADSIGELLGVMGRAGVDRALAIDTLVQALERVATKRQQLIDRDTQPRFSANALLKDLRLAHAARQQLRASAPLMDCALAAFEHAVETGVGNEDYVAVGLAVERALDR
ncbi:MAG TPA: NAD(P)-dependent oxidoreductase [Candidatus Cybelea sp.]|jgi:3-hydroxyisobutyrate dehydrogenase-like beta-hydroxyacid dehydrogenase|nr:NAD(P)-dependent oxidoreductase [Candidatus Cybelea sp.]